MQDEQLTNLDMWMTNKMNFIISCIKPILLH